MLFALTCSEEIHPFKVLNYILYFISHEKVCTQAEAQASSSYDYTCGCDIPHPPPGRGTLSYTGRLSPKVVPFSGFRYIAYGFHKFKYMKGEENLSILSGKGLQ